MSDLGKNKFKVCIHRAKVQLVVLLVCEIFTASFWPTWQLTDRIDDLLRHLMTFWHTWRHSDTPDNLLTHLTTFWHTDTPDDLLTHLTTFWHTWQPSDTPDNILTHLTTFWKTFGRQSLIAWRWLGRAFTIKSELRQLSRIKTCPADKNWWSQEFWGTLIPSHDYNWQAQRRPLRIFAADLKNWYWDAWRADTTTLGCLQWTGK